MNEPSPLGRLWLSAALMLVAVPGLAQTETFVDRWDNHDLRVVSYNVLWNTIFEGPSTSELPGRFARVINALQPDVLALQEVTRGASATAQLLNSIAPLPEGATWHAHSHSDNVILSRFPFAQTLQAGGHADVLVDLPDDRFDRDLFVLGDHLPCCSHEPGRQFEADQIVRWLEDGRTAGGEFDLPDETPMLVVGDLNIVGSGRPLETLLTGDLFDNDRFGPDSPPDWDGTPLVDARPPHNGTGPEDYTWRDDTQRFDPGILDFVLYTDSVLETANRFVLNPATMSAEDRAATGLQPADVQIDETLGIYDHLPVVVDFRLRTEPVGGDYNGDGTVDAADYSVWQTAYGDLGSDLPADGNRDGTVNAADYTIWRDAFAPPATANVPEPTAAGLLLPLLVAWLGPARIGLLRRQRRF